MKNLFCLFLIVLICSCKKQTIQEKKIEEYFYKYGNNPDSYEPIETKLIRTQTLRNEIVEEMNALTYSIENNKKDMKSGSRHLRSYYKDQLQKNTDSYNLKKVQLDSLLNSDNPNVIKYHIYQQTCRATVPLGGKMLKTLTVMFDKDYNIISVYEDSPGINSINNY